MGDLQQGKGKGKYNQWTSQESKMLLGLLVEGIKHGWRDASGAISKHIVETKILSVLNEKLGCQKTYKHYQNHMKWFKNQYHIFADLLCYSSRFGWDAASKKFTADNEVWEEYFKSHPSKRNLRNGSFEDYENLLIIFGNRTTVGKNVLGLGDATDARTYEVEENEYVKQDENLFDDNNEVHESDYTSSPFLDTNLETPIEKPPPIKKARTEYQTYSSPTETITQADLLEKVCVGMDSIATIANEIKIIRGLMEKRENDRVKRKMEKNEVENKNNIWDSIKEIPNMDSHSRYKVLALVHKLGMKDIFLKMSLEDRLGWIQYNME